MDSLAERIERQLKQREFSLAFADGLQSFSPIENIGRPEGEIHLQAFAKLHGSSASVIDTDPRLTRAIFMYR